MLLGAELAGVFTEADAGVGHAAARGWRGRYGGDDEVEMPGGEQFGAGGRRIADFGFGRRAVDFDHRGNGDGGGFGGGAEVDLRGIDISWILGKQ